MLQTNDQNMCHVRKDADTMWSSLVDDFAFSHAHTGMHLIKGRRESCSAQRTSKAKSVKLRLVIAMTPTVRRPPVSALARFNTCMRTSSILNARCVGRSMDLVWDMINTNWRLDVCHTTRCCEQRGTSWTDQVTMYVNVTQFDSDEHLRESKCERCSSGVWSPRWKLPTGHRYFLSLTSGSPISE